MTVTARLFAAAAEAVGRNELEIEASSVADLRAALSSASDSAAPVIRQCAVLRAGVRLDEATALLNGDAVDVLPPFAGG